MEKIDPNKIPTPPLPDKVDLFLPLNFWSEILITLDKKLQALSTGYGYGSVKITITVHDGEVKEVMFDDNIRIRGLVEKSKTQGKKLDNKDTV